MTTTPTTTRTPTYGWASQVRTLEAVQAQRIAKTERLFIARSDGPVAMANWRLSVAILEVVTRDLAEARRMAVA